MRSILLFREGLDWEQCREALMKTVLSLNPNHVEASSATGKGAGQLCSTAGNCLRSRSRKFAGHSILLPAYRYPTSAMDAGLAFSC